MAWFDKLLVLGMPLVPRFFMRKLGGRYVAGEQREGALELGAKLEAGGYRVTYDVLGESVAHQADVEEALVEYRALFAELKQRGLELNLSTKPTQMGLLIDEDLCYRSVAELVRMAAAEGGFVRYEMEDSPTTDATLRVYDRLREEFGGRVGCVLQSMLRRTDDDVAALLARDQPLNVRMVKGIYLEPEEIAYQQPQEVVDSYLRATRALLEGGAFVGAATHDDQIVDGLQRLVAERPEWAERCELQMLLGVREDLRQRARAEGLPVRVYVPYGSHWLPYVQRRLRKNPRLARMAMLGLFRRREQLG